MHPLSVRAPSCRRGHPWNDVNSGYRIDHRTGRTYRVCRMCASMRERLKYRNDAEYREREKTRCRNNYRAKRSESFTCA